MAQPGADGTACSCLTQPHQQQTGPPRACWLVRPSGTHPEIAMDDLPALSPLLDDEQAPVIGDALEAVRATIDELETGARDEISYRAGDEYLVWAS